ncbi:MAG: hypothetical protein MUC96_10300 [Myxococcaceae bacterium]|jgi:hypothetical protein|nr:hypothetical protein [Myxococcaceae bacterium]
MSLSLAVALVLSAADAPSNDAVSLASSAFETRGARLLAQAPPPLPDRTSGGSAARIAQLDAEITSLNDQLRALNTDWPFGALAMAYVGWIVSPVALVGLVILGVGALAMAPQIITVGVIVLVVGLAAVALGIAGIVVGVSASGKAKEEKQQLERRRRELQDELRALKGQAASGLGAPGGTLFTLATF